MRDKRKVQVIKISVFITSIFVILLSVTYAFINVRLTGTKKQVIITGNLELELKEDENNIMITNALPMHDEVGMLQSSFTFRLINKTSVNTNYVLKLIEIGTGTLPKNIVKYGLVKDGTSKIDFISNITDGSIDSGVVKGDQTINYALCLWIDSSVEDNSFIQGKSLSYKIEIEATQIPEKVENKCIPVENGEDMSGASEPVIKGDMIPVVYDECEMVWKKADTTKTWYNYDIQTWANAVIPMDKTITYEVGDTIPEENIESYFVWIPRYRYKIFNKNHSISSSLNANAPQTIEIEFESKDTIVSSGSTVGEWLSHPAFTAFGTNGIWVGKFESGSKGATSLEESEVSTTDSNKLIVRPSVYSWRNIAIGNAFQVSYEYSRSLESHMMKNTEWGAVAYLSHSKYGKQGFKEKNTEVYINNNNNYVTGCGGDTASADSTSTCLNACGSKVDNIYNQSTTGNVTGIFDMSGGTYEYVMGYNAEASIVGGSSGITSIYSDFFTDDEKWSKYYDKYNSSSNTSYSSRILGDATGEMGPFANDTSSWYSDYAYFVNSNSPWFSRGGYHSGTLNAGVFYFNYRTGGSHKNVSFRVILAPSN